MRLVDAMLLGRKLPLPSSWLKYIVVGMVAFSIGLGGGWARWKRPASHNKSYRHFIIREYAQQMPPGGTIVIGDSLVERQYLRDICGPTLNAGIGGATSADLQDLAPELVRIAKPARIVFNVGTNDVYQSVPGPE